MGVRVLLTDADTILLSLYRDILLDHQCEVRTAATALDCLELLRQWRPDVLVLDEELPWGSGLGVLALMREEDTLPQVPVILLTWGDSVIAEEEDSYRVQLSLLKPVSGSVLTNAIRSIANPNRNDHPGRLCLALS